MRHAHATLYARLLASDPTHDGQFFTGVLTTGIYCLPSCHARKPKAENVRFFPTCEAARAAGLRACKKCHPDDYALGADPVLETVEQAVAELRADPAQFRDAAALIRRTGYGATRAGELLRHHFHASPAELVTGARLAALQTRLHGEAGVSVADHVFAAGYESLAVVHEHFRARLGLTPAAWRALGGPGVRTFAVALPPGYPLEILLRQLGRDPASLSERREGNVVTFAVWLEKNPVRLRLTFSKEEVMVEIFPASETSVALAPAAHRIVAGLLGLGQDAAGFARRARKLGLARLVAGREGWIGSQTPGLWDALAWAIIGQQINLAFAFRLRRSLTELAGTPVGKGMVALPDAATVAALDSAKLRARSFSAGKARTLIETAGLVARGELDLEKLAAGPATRAERALLAVRGLGPWTTNYVLMRGAGFADCVPYGDTGVTSGLQALFNLEVRPDAAATRRLMLCFAPWRSLATYQLWQFSQRPMVEEASAGRDGSPSRPQRGLDQS
jgi:AraC family transcriptional regulator of adaptative response / DNA-3-methyladenine glycosylase II